MLKQHDKVSSKFNFNDMCAPNHRGLAKEAVVNTDTPVPSALSNVAAGADVAQLVEKLQVLDAQVGDTRKELARALGLGTQATKSAIRGALKVAGIQDIPFVLEDGRKKAKK